MALLGTGDWTTVQDYPYGGEFFGDYEMVYVPATSAYYVIGGYDGRGIVAKIGMFKNGVWSGAGQLIKARSVSFCSFLCFKIINSILRIIKLNG